MALGSFLRLDGSGAPGQTRKAIPQRLSLLHGRKFDFSRAMNDLGKFLVIAGLVLVGLGLLLWSGFGKGWIGRLPGDIHYAKGDFRFHLPIVTCLLISAVLTLLLWLFRK